MIPRRLCDRKSRDPSILVASLAWSLEHTNYSEIRKLQNTKIRQELGITLRNRFQALEEGKNIDEKWARCKNAITDTCEQVLGCWEARRKDWITDDTWEAIEARRETKMKLNKEADDTRKK